MSINGRFVNKEWRYLYSPSCREKLSEKSRTHLQRVALRATEMVLFGPFWPPYTGQIYGWGVAPTPFRTVSEGVFSETHIPHYESLYNGTGGKPILSLQSLALKMHLVTRLDRYSPPQQGPLSFPSSVEA